MDIYTLPRVYLPTETLGSIYGPDQALICKTMELPWRNNESNVSCIPEGDYVIKKMDARPGRDYGHFRFYTVAGRGKNKELGMSTILIHRITYVKDLKGCIGVGGRFIDLNKDGVPDIADSGKKLEWMYQNLPDNFILRIFKKP